LRGRSRSLKYFESRQIRPHEPLYKYRESNVVLAVVWGCRDHAFIYLTGSNYHRRWNSRESVGLSTRSRGTTGIPLPSDPARFAFKVASSQYVDVPPVYHLLRKRASTHPPITTDRLESSHQLTMFWGFIHVVTTTQCWRTIVNNHNDDKHTCCMHRTACLGTTRWYRRQRYAERGPGTVFRRQEG
jgi:hypothetical protein